MNEIGYCPENGKMDIPEYSRNIWEMDGVNGQLKKIITDLPIGDHQIGDVSCRDDYLYWGQGFPSNSGFADPDNHGWPDQVEDAVDLHAFGPRDVVSVVDEYLRAAQRAGFREVRLIHGRGTGTRCLMVRPLLERHPLVHAFADAPPERGGWGATIVRLA
jgi:hypothetical protein